MPAISRGSLYRRKGTRNWCLKFYLDGKPQRESTGTHDRGLALEVLRRRLAEVARGRFTAASQRPSFSDLRARLLENYEFKRNRTTPSTQLKHLGDFFGGQLGEEITEERIWNTLGNV